jgi:hypothetical protein
MSSEPNTVRLPPIRTDIKDARVNANLDLEAARKERNDALMQMRLDAKAKVESGEVKPADAYKQLNSEAKDQRTQTKEEIEKIRADFKMTVKADLEKGKEMLGEKRGELLQAIQDKRDLFKEEFEARKDEMQAKREDMRAKFQADLLKIKDENKRARVENISNNFAEINISVTTRASGIVDQIETVLVSIESRTDKAATNGADVTKVRASIVVAETAIADARVAIAAQVAKVYETSITSDATVKNSLQSTRDQFRADLQAMNTKIKAAHSATRKAAEALKAIPNVDAEVTVNAEANTN